MSVLVDIEEYDDPGIKICPNGTQGESLELGGLVIVLPVKPPKKTNCRTWKRKALADVAEERYASGTV